MNQNTTLVVGLLIGLTLGMLFGGEIAEKIYQQKIIEQGVGEWQVDPVTGETKFIIFDRESLAK